MSGDDLIDLDYSRIHTPPPPPLLPKRCLIENILTGNKIYLPHRKEFTLGRRRELHISDKKLSRHQLECYVDADNLYFAIRQIGRSISGIDGQALLDDIQYELNENEILELRLNQHKFRVRFETKPINKILINDPNKGNGQEEKLECKSSKDKENEGSQEESDRGRDKKKDPYSEEIACSDDFSDFEANYLTVSHEEQCVTYNEIDSSHLSLSVIQLDSKQNLPEVLPGNDDISGSSYDKPTNFYDLKNEDNEDSFNSDINYFENLSDETVTNEESPERDYFLTESESSGKTKYLDSTDAESHYSVENLNTDSISSEGTIFHENSGVNDVAATNTERPFIKIFDPASEDSNSQDQVDTEDDSVDPNNPNIDVNAKKLRLH